jgi:predicted GIY-YIG superfamily endonuclease
MAGYVYILECANGMYYVGSTTDLKLRIREHQDGLGANFTHKHMPVKLVYFETFQMVEEAFKREKKLQGWSRKKKEALIFGQEWDLHNLSKCKNKSNSRLYRKQQKQKKKPESPPDENSNPSETED